MSNILILWIEDDYYHVKGLMKPLIKEGYEFDIARSCHDALQKLTKFDRYSIIILDLIIPYSEKDLNNPNIKRVYDPSQNGIDLFYHIKDKLKVDKPIIILSIVKNGEIRKELLEKGAVTWLNKDIMLPQDVKNAVLEITRSDDNGIA